MLLSLDYKLPNARAGNKSTNASVYVWGTLVTSERKRVTRTALENGKNKKKKVFLVGVQFGGYACN